MDVAQHLEGRNGAVERGRDRGPINIDQGRSWF
jgi:hypothetical protein